VYQQAAWRVPGERVSTPQPEKTSSGGVGAQIMATPPFGRITCPVMNLEASEAR